MHQKRLLLIIILGGCAIIFVLYQLWLGTGMVETQTLVRAPRLIKEVINPSIPETTYLDVPYTVQAPYAKWDVYDEEACEEAALLMAYEYLQESEYPNNVILKEQAQQELRRMQDFQVEQLGYELTTDLFPEELKLFVESYWPGYTISVHPEISIDEIKKEIAQGNPLVIPATAKILENPWYHYEDYHMLVIIGYEGNEFITNDPGTKRGEDFRYSQDLVLKALQDSKSKAFILIKK